MYTLSTSSWTTHGLLGEVRYEHDLERNSWLEGGNATTGMSLLDLPAFVAKDGIHKIEICHFHLPSLQSDYLAKLKNAHEKAGVTLENILVDRGNLSSSDDAEWRAEIELCKMWFDVAAELGGNGCRIDCGTEEPTPAAKARSAAALRELADHAAGMSLTLTTENFRQTSLQPGDLLDIIKMADRPIGLCVDVGNAAKSGDKFGTLQEIMPSGTSLHCKGEYRDGKLDTADLERSMQVVKDGDFSGFISLIVDETENEWEKTLELRDHILSTKS